VAYVLSGMLLSVQYDSLVLSVCPSVCPSVCLWRCGLWLNGAMSYSKSLWTSK